LYDKGFKITDEKVQRKIGEAKICMVYNMSPKDVNKLSMREFLEKSLIATYVSRIL
jgi:hypothetical protein